MRRPISGLLLLIAAALLRPAPLIAAECGIDDPESAGYIRDGLWRFRTLDTLSSERPAIVRVAADGTMERGFDGRHLGRSGGVAEREPMRAHRVRDESGERSGAWAKLETLSSASSGTQSARSGDNKESGLPATNSIPEPGNGAMLIAGLLGIWTVARRRIYSI